MNTQCASLAVVNLHSVKIYLNELQRTLLRACELALLFFSAACMYVTYVDICWGQMPPLNLGAVSAKKLQQVPPWFIYCNWFFRHGMCVVQHTFSFFYVYLNTYFSCVKVISRTYTVVTFTALRFAGGVQRLLLWLLY